MIMKSFTNRTEILNEHVKLPVSLSRSIAADKSLTHPKKADGEDKFNEFGDVLLLLLPFPFDASRDEPAFELFVDDDTLELLLDELLSEKNT